MLLGEVLARQSRRKECEQESADVAVEGGEDAVKHCSEREIPLRVGPSSLRLYFVDFGLGIPPYCPHAMRILTDLRLSKQNSLGKHQDSGHSNEGHQNVVLNLTKYPVHGRVPITPQRTQNPGISNFVNEPEHEYDEEAEPPRADPLGRVLVEVVRGVVAAVQEVEFGEDVEEAAADNVTERKRIRA